MMVVYILCRIKKYLEDAVDFKTDGLILESQELVERLTRARISFNSDMSSSQEEGSCDGPVRRERVEEVPSKKQYPDKENNSLTRDKSCEKHPGVELEYWCVEDEMMVCKECLIARTTQGREVFDQLNFTF